MNLYPQHLRERQHAEIIRRRSYGVYGGQMPPTYQSGSALPPRRGRLGKIWARGSGLTDEEAATGLPAATIQTSVCWAVALFGVLTTTALTVLAENLQDLSLAAATVVGALAAAAVLRLSIVSLPRSAFRAMYRRPLSVEEIDALLPEAHDEISREYLALVTYAISQNVPAENLQDLQVTIKTLGEAVDHMPSTVSVPLNTAAIRAEAAVLSEQALREPDRVISESLERRADALSRRADAGDLSALISRRAHALRAEVKAQMDALREGLVWFHNGATDSSALARLSQDARRVAAEATAVAQSREELDAPMREMRAIAPDAQATQRAGRS